MHSLSHKSEIGWTLYLLLLLDIPHALSAEAAVAFRFRVEELLAFLHEAVLALDHLKGHLCQCLGSAAACLQPVAVPFPVNEPQCLSTSLGNCASD